MVQSRICVVALVGKHGFQATFVVSLASSQHEAERPLKLTGEQVDFVCQTSST
jgi:hypothetical protein